MLISSTTEHRVQMCHQVFFAKLVCLPVDLAELPITKCQTIYVGVGWEWQWLRRKSLLSFLFFPKRTQIQMPIQSDMHQQMPTKGYSKKKGL